MQNSHLISKPIVRIEGKNLIRGHAKYATDLSFPGMLFAKTFRCLFPHAKVLEIKTSKAEQLDGVVCILTAKDIPGVNAYGFPEPDQPVLIEVGGRARMVGEPLAVVAAVSEKIAEEAVRLIEAEYEQYEVIDDPVKVLEEPEKHLIHPSAFCGSYAFSRGDIEKACLEADVIVDECFTLPFQEQAYIETESGVALVEMDGMLTVIAATHDPLEVRHSVARSLGIKETMVRCVVPPIGGSFGGKQQISVHILLALLALKTGKPVKMVWTREESIQLHGKRHWVKIQHKMGATKEGKINFMSVDYLMDGGPYAQTSGGVCFWMGCHFAGPYTIPNISIMGKAVYTNNAIGAAYRGFGGPQAVIATERQIEKLARALSMDPIAFRQLNYLTVNDQPGLDGICLDSRITADEAVQLALNKVGTLPYPSEESKKVGRGIAVCMPLYDVSADPGYGMKGTGASVEAFRDGTVEVRTGSVELGTGLNTVLAQIAANELGVMIEQVRVISGDSAITPKVGRSVASKGAYCSGNAVKIAAQELKLRLSEIAAVKFGIYPTTAGLVFENGNVYNNQSKEKAILLAEIAEFAYVEGINLVANSWFVGKHALFGNTFVASVVDVEVDMHTGEATVLNCAISHDCGQILNPLSARAQLIGAGVQALGYALSEKLIVSKGRMKTTSFHDYLIPSSLDVPNIEVAFIEEKSPNGPYGAKGLGEMGLFATSAATVNAVANALGKDVSEIPLTPDKVYELINF